MRSILCYLAFALLALAGPVSGVQAVLAPAAQGCLCGCAGAQDEPCRCPEPAQPPPGGKADAPCHAPTGVGHAPAKGVRSATETLAGEVDPAPVAKAEASPWPAVAFRTIQALPPMAGTLRCWDGRQDPPHNRDRLAQLERFLI